MRLNTNADDNLKESSCHLGAHIIPMFASSIDKLISVKGIAEIFNGIVYCDNANASS